MKIDWPKLMLYVVVAGFAAAITYFAYHPYKFATPPEPKVVYRTITKTVEVPGPTVVKEVIKEVPAPCNCTRVTVPKPAVKAPVAKAPVVVKPHPKFVPRPRNPAPECNLVPAAAYAHPQDVVVASATRQGLTGEPLNILKRCIGAR